MSDIPTTPTQEETIPTTPVVEEAPVIAVPDAIPEVPAELEQPVVEEKKEEVAPAAN